MPTNENVQSYNVGKSDSEDIRAYNVGASDYAPRKQILELWTMKKLFTRVKSVLGK